MRPWASVFAAAEGRFSLGKKCSPDRTSTWALASGRPSGDRTINSTVARGTSFFSCAGHIQQRTAGHAHRSARPRTPISLAS